MYQIIKHFLYQTMFILKYCNYSFHFIYPIAELTYSTTGRPTIDPIVLIKLVFIQYLFGIRFSVRPLKKLKPI